MKKKIILSGIILVFFFVLGTAFKVSAITRGWIWGGSEGTDGATTGVGWIEVSGSNYGIDIPPGDGPITGYAWSSNLGWIDFGNNCTTGPAVAGKYQAASCTPDAIIGCEGGAGVRRSGNELVGCARIVSIAQETVRGNSGGWEGWIKMNGSGYGIKLNADGSVQPCDGAHKSCAWNGEEAGTGGNIASGLGWFDFSKVTADAKNSLKICKDRCDNDNHPVVANINPGDYIILKACFNTSTKCDDSTGDVTDSATWSENPSDVVNPAIDKGKYEADANAAGKNTTVTAEHTTSSGIKYTDIATIYVGCVLDPAWCDLPEQKTKKENTCSNSFFKDNCGGLTCKGTKNCTEWKEVGPKD
jgi:hypothetical protein